MSLGFSPQFFFFPFNSRINILSILQTCCRQIKNFFSSVIEPTSQIGLVEQAIHSGGFLGVGPEMVRLNESPDAHTDFIIAVAIEEFG